MKEFFYSIKTSFHLPRTEASKEAMEDLQDIFGKDMQILIDKEHGGYYLVRINYFKSLPESQIDAIEYELEYISGYIINPVDVFIERGVKKLNYTLGKTDAKKKIISILNKLTEQKQNQILSMINVMIQD